MVLSDTPLQPHDLPISWGIYVEVKVCKCFCPKIAR